MFGQRNKMPASEAIDTYLASLRAAGRTKSTIRTYHHILCHLSKSLGPTRSVQGVTSADLTHYLAGFQDRRLSLAYVSLCGRVVKSFFGWLAEVGEITTSPMNAIKPCTPAAGLVEPFSDDELRRLIGAAITPLERAVIMLLTDTGVRASELTGMRMQDVDLKQGLMRVRGKGGKVRCLALNDQPKQALEAYLTSGGAYDGCLWPIGFKYHVIHYLVRSVGRRAGVPAVHPHRFRHTFATKFWAETGDALALQSLLGHSSFEMVKRYIAAAQGEIALSAHREHSPMAGLQGETRQRRGK